MSDRFDIYRLMRNREKLYRFFARLFEREVDQEFYEQLKHVKFQEDLDVTSITELQDAVIRLNEYFKYDMGESLDDLAADFASTFLGPGRAEGEAAFPYESVYTSPKRIMMQDAWSEVSQLYRDKGLELGNLQDGLMEDHIAIELEYMAFLCDETCHHTEQLFGLEEQRGFLNRHLLNWIPEFCLDIKRYADTEFYRMVGQLTTGFIQFDSFLLETMISELKARSNEKRSYLVSRRTLDQIVDRLKNDYNIYGPKRVPGRYRSDGSSVIRYQELNSIDEIVNSEQSDFSPKEVYYPISQTIFRFREDSIVENLNNDPKGIIIFARPCDIEGTRRLDNMFLANGGNSDVYYERLREKVRFVLLECPESWENCCCASMGSNQTSHYSMAVSLGNQNGTDPNGGEEQKPAWVKGFIEVQVADAEFFEFFEGEEACSYEPRFIQENRKKMRVPDIDDPCMMQEINDLPFWKEYNDQCISCGGCNAVCPTCSCFETVDFLDEENSLNGQRRRVWSSCMLPEFSKTAGGHIDRPKPDKMMRFKAMHKTYDYRKRFGGSDHMCVGCGRCTTRCPEDISFIDTVNRLHDGVEAIKAERKARQEEEAAQANSWVFDSAQAARVNLQQEKTEE